ncbi:hypothetical protein BDR06DRAFT_970600 [Suillus hirtellus]|nr:hypothetical protein BDR06DRAFT_970600 [Suillus hirtellus]
MSDKLSGSSPHFLCSWGTIDVTSAAASCKTSRKAPTMWIKAEETTFLEFLLQALPASGDECFKASTFNQAYVHLKIKHPHQRGTEKVGTVCKNKWTSLKKAYQSVVEIKYTSGFTWSDNHEAGIMDKKDDLHSHIRPFMMKGFDHFNIIQQLMLSKSKGSYTTDNALPGPPPSSVYLPPSSMDLPPSSGDPPLSSVDSLPSFLTSFTEGSTSTSGSAWTSISRRNENAAHFHLHQL